MHTPGPWKTGGFQNVVVNAADGSTIVACPGGSAMAPLSEHKANAALIAAAPEMLEALEMVLIASEDGGDMNDIDFDQLRAAVAKAKNY